MITLSEAKDPEQIKNFMLTDEVWGNFSDDMGDKEQYEVEVSSRNYWVKVLIDNDLAGMVLLNNHNLSTLGFHPYLLKKYKAQSRELIIIILKTFLKAPMHINKIIVEIPTHRKIVYNLAKKIGFIDEGVNRKSFLKDGVFLDQWNLGLTRKEVEKIV